MNRFLRQPSAVQRTPLRAERPDPRPGAAGSVSLRLYDAIDSWGGDWGVSAKEFASTLDALPEGTSEIRLLINSPGGEVWEGLAILNLLRAHPAQVVAVVEGIAASAASFIAAGADELLMMPNSELFVHRAWGLTIGNAEDLRKLSDDLDHEDRNLAAVYAAKAGGTVEEWLTAMTAETWYSADEAVAVKLADRVVAPAAGAGTGAAQNRWDRKVLAQTGHRTAAAVRKPPASPGSSPEGRTPVEITDEQLTKLRNQAGVADDADLDTTIEAVGEALEEKAEPAPVTPADPAVADLVEQNKVLAAETRRMSGELAELKASRAADEKSAFFASAVQTGRLKPADEAAWSARWDKAGGSDFVRDVVGGRAAGSEVPVDALGHSGGLAGTDPTEDDRLLAALGFATPKVSG